MRMNRTALAFAAVLCAIAFAKSAVSADKGRPRASPGNRRPIHGDIRRILTHLVNPGFEVSAIRAAWAGGDTDAARSLPELFIEKHKDQLFTPQKRAGQGGVCNTTRLKEPDDNLTSMDFNLSAMRNAPESGDTDPSHSLPGQCINEQRDEFPAPPGRQGAGNLGNPACLTEWPDNLISMGSICQPSGPPWSAGIPAQHVCSCGISSTSADDGLSPQSRQIYPDGIIHSNRSQ